MECEEWNLGIDGERNSGSAGDCISGNRNRSLDHSSTDHSSSMEHGTSDSERVNSSPENFLTKDSSMMNKYNYVSLK